MTAAIVTVVLALDPIGIARVWPRRLEAGAVVALVLGAAALLATTALDVLDLSPEGYWIAAGLVLLVPGVGRLVQATKDVGIHGETAFVLTSDHGMGEWDRTLVPTRCDSESRSSP